MAQEVLKIINGRPWGFIQIIPIPAPSGGGIALWFCCFCHFGTVILTCCIRPVLMASLPHNREGVELFTISLGNRNRSTVTRTGQPTQRTARSCHGSDQMGPPW